MTGIVVMMYHALYDGDSELRDIDDEDRPYAVSVAQFARHLAVIRDNACVLGFEQAIGRLKRPSPDSRPPPSVLLTFDDGHRSGYRHAMPILKRFGMSAVFFVTTNFIGRRPGFASWSELRSMRAAGLAIQSHGVSHRFLDDMLAMQARSEFAASQAIIEQEISQPVVAISFPGGRFRSDSLALGREAGFSHFFTSRVGVNSGSSLPAGRPLRRFAVRPGTSEHTIARIVRAEVLTVGPLMAAERVKRVARRALGNRIYHWAYRRGAS